MLAATVHVACSFRQKCVFSNISNACMCGIVQNDATKINNNRIRIENKTE